VIPTCVDPRNYPIAACQNPAQLVWVGSASTLKGLDQARPIWEALATAVPGLKLRVICDRFPDSFPLPIVPVVWNQQTEAHAIAAGHIGISWIPDDLWSRGKCGLKVLQYQAAGLPVIANPVGVHREMVREGETGFLASSPSEWVLAVTRLVSDARMRHRMGLMARRQLETDYSVSAWSETFVTSMTGGSRIATATSWKADRAQPRTGRKVGASHRARGRASRTLNQIGDR
jgi:Glycosyl transferases group 1